MPVAAPSDAELRAALEAALAGAGLEAPKEVRRRPSAYKTSFPLEELELTLADGERRRLAFKRLDWDCLDDRAQLAKPRFLHDPRREPAVYAFLLEPAGLGSPRYFGSVVDEEGAGRHWLFVEWVDGRELYQVGEFELWLIVARRLGEMHRALGAALQGIGAELPLLDHDAVYYRRWIERAAEFRGGSSGGEEERRGIAWLAERYDAVVECLDSMPRTVIHGELYASNVLVAGDASALRVAPVDWELAARGPGLIDLAALASGNWDAAERSELAAAYCEGVGEERASTRELDFARLHLAVQWLGWAPPAWIPPAGQQHDWLGEALILAERLEL